MWRAGIGCLCVLLMACAGDPPRAPVEQRRGVQRVGPPADTYTVVRGDTLYAIAWRYGQDYRELARRNHISHPYTIYPGQTLALRGDAPPPRARPAAGAPAAGTPAAGAPAASGAVAANPSPPRTAARQPAPTTGPVAAWSWPTNGEVVRRFSGTVHKGVDIDGKAGDAVRATAAGNVVYAGSGIVGYGQLLIVKHNEVYLSAYGHNRRLLVGEGEQVAAGQHIAEMGSTGTNTVKLHFEIRREGKPIDPLRLLPSR
jgi:lipoprotein NlpD